MKKILLILALLSLGVSKAQVVGGYLPVNSTKSATMGGLRVNGNETVTGTFSVGSTATITGALKASSTMSLGSANLTGGNTGTVAVLSDVPFIVYLNGSNSAGTISDATTYYISGTGFILSSNTSATDGQVLIPWNCTLIGYSFNNRVNGTTATSETSTLSLRVDNTTDITLSSAITFSANQSNFTSSALSSTIASGSLINAKIVTPTWVTNPSNIFTGLYLYFTRRP